MSYRNLKKNTARALLLIVAFCSTFISCRSSKELIEDYAYFEKHPDTLKSIVNKLKEPIIQKNDQLSITVHSASLNQDQAQVFNVLNTSSVTGASGGANGATLNGYLVDFDGNISLPVIGKIKAEGLPKTELNKILVEKLSPFVKDPVVNIRFLSFKVMVLGGVENQGPQNFDNERATIIDAIGQAGGLTDFGKRNNILVIREKPDGMRTTDTLNINDASMFASPAFQLQQNDVIYVSTNTLKLKNINTNPTIYRDIPFFLSLISTILLFANLLIK